MPHLEQKSIFTFAAPQTSGKAKLLRRPRAPASPSRAGLSFICTLPAQKAQTKHEASCRTCCAQSQGQLSQHPWALPGWHRRCRAAVPPKQKSAFQTCKERGTKYMSVSWKYLLPIQDCYRGSWNKLHKEHKLYLLYKVTDKNRDGNFIHKFLAVWFSLLTFTLTNRLLIFQSRELTAVSRGV